MASVKKTLHDLGKDTDKSWAHQYLHVYEALFEPVRNKATNVLEVGIYEGGSLSMWRDYFPKATVYGLDVTNRLTGDYDTTRMQLRFENAYTTEAIEAFGDIRFDVMVDDGPHTFESQKYFIENYSKLLSKNGILVVEDIPKYEWTTQFAQVVPDALKPYAYIVDRRIAPDRHSIDDEIMFVIDKRFCQ